MVRPSRVNMLYLHSGQLFLCCHVVGLLTVATVEARTHTRWRGETDRGGYRFGLWLEVEISVDVEWTLQTALAGAVTQKISPDVLKILHADTTGAGVNYGGVVLHPPLPAPRHFDYHLFACVTYICIQITVGH